MVPAALTDPLWWVARRLRQFLAALAMLALATGAGVGTSPDADVTARVEAAASFETRHAPPAAVTAADAVPGSWLALTDAATTYRSVASRSVELPAGQPAEVNHHAAEHAPVGITGGPSPAHHQSIGPGPALTRWQPGHGAHVAYLGQRAPPR